MRQPERDRILSGGDCELIHERLYGKDVDVCAQRAQCRDAQRHSGDQVIDHALIGKIIERHRVAVAAPRRLRNIGRRPRLARLGDVPAGQEIVVPARCGRSGAVSIAPYLIDPVDDPAIRVERGFGAREHGRAVWLPGELVIAHPLQAHRPSGNGAGQQCRIEGHIVSAVVPVTARAFGVNTANRIGIELQRLGKVALEREHALRMAPHRQPAVVEFGDRTRRADRGMRQIGSSVGRL